MIVFAAYTPIHEPELLMLPSQFRRMHDRRKHVLTDYTSSHQPRTFAFIYPLSLSTIWPVPWDASSRLPLVCSPPRRCSHPAQSRHIGNMRQVPRDVTSGGRQRFCWPLGQDSRVRAEIQRREMSPVIRRNGSPAADVAERWVVLC